MFFIEDPSAPASAKRRELRQSLIRSHVASTGWRTRLTRDTTPQNTRGAGEVPSKPSNTSAFRAYSTHAPETQENRHFQGSSRQAPLGSFHPSAQQDHNDRSCRCANLMTRSQAPFAAPINAQANCFCTPLRPTLREYSSDQVHENTALQFFVERTAAEWSGWLDEHIWKYIALQLSTTQPALRHAMISLALHHRCLELQDKLQQESTSQLSLSHGRKALNLLFREYVNMPLGAILTSHIVITAFTALLDNETGYQALQIQYDLLNHISPDSEQDPFVQLTADILNRRRARHGRVVDMLWALDHAPTYSFAVETPTHHGNEFESLRDARQLLEHILKWFTYQVKLKGKADHLLFLEAFSLYQTWLQQIQARMSVCSSSEDEMQSAELLKVCGKLGLVMIQTMTSREETVFDKYTSVFHELADVFESNTVYRRRKHRANVTFNLDSGLICYVGHTAVRWCREPALRSRLIDLLIDSKRQEGIEPALAWASVSRYVKMIEEYGIWPPPSSCSQIPEANRIRILSSDYFWKSRLAHVQYFQPPWQEDNVHDLWMAYDGPTFCFAPSPGLCIGNFPPTYQETDRPDLCFSRGGVAWKIKGSGHYYNLQTNDFHFPLPRT